MQRFSIDMSRYATGSKLTDRGFRARSAMNDLAFTSVDRVRCVAPSSTINATRLLLHRGPDTEPDQAVEVVIDRASPNVSGDFDPLGLLLGWKVGGTRSSQMICAGGASAPPAFFGEVRDDEALGQTNHIRVSVGTLLEIVEYTEDSDGVPVSRTLWSMALTAAHRRLALRAASVEGDIVLWWNPTGALEFEEAPIARVHSLIGGSARTGIFCGRDGRFLSLNFEYRTGIIAPGVPVFAVEHPDVELSPVMIGLTADLSRPPMVTMMQASHVGDTKLPERQERTSRIHPRSARFLLRPGHEYIATAVYLNVDGDTIAGVSRPFSIDGTPEDLELRDCLGRRIALPGDDGTDEKSDLDLLIWPAAIDCRKNFRTSAAPGRTDLADTMDVTRRGTQRSSLAPRLFSYSVLEDEVGRQTLLDFLAQARGRTVPFIWTHPKTGELVICNFQESRLVFKPEEAGLYSATVNLAEEPRCLGKAEGPASPGYSVALPPPGSSGEPPPPTGACCFDDAGCLEVTQEDCLAAGGTYHGDFSVCEDVECGTGCEGCEAFGPCFSNDFTTFTLVITPKCVCNTGGGCPSVSSAPSTTLVLTRVPSAPGSMNFAFGDGATQVSFGPCQNAPDVYRWSFLIDVADLNGYDPFNVNGPCGEACSWSALQNSGRTKDDWGVQDTSTYDKSVPALANMAEVLCEPPLGECDQAWLQVDGTLGTCCEVPSALCEGFRSYNGFCENIR